MMGRFGRHVFVGVFSFLVTLVAVWNIQAVTLEQSALVGALTTIAAVCSYGPAIWSAKRDDTWEYFATLVVCQGLGAYTRMVWSTGVWV